MVISVLFGLLLYTPLDALRIEVELTCLTLELDFLLELAVGLFRRYTRSHFML